MGNKFRKMKHTDFVLVIICLSLLFANQTTAQNDSVIINKINDHFIEVKSLRHILHKSYAGSPDTAYDNKYKFLTGSYIYENYTPKGPRLNNGIVVIKDWLDRPLAFYLYADSFPVQVSHYTNGRIVWERYYFGKDSLSIDKYFWNNGNIRVIIYYYKDKEEEYFYSENGQFIKPKE
jgi:hypothetical protein